MNYQKQKWPTSCLARQRPAWRGWTGAPEKDPDETWHGKLGRVDAWRNNWRDSYSIRLSALFRMGFKGVDQCTFQATHLWFAVVLGTKYFRSSHLQRLGSNSCLWMKEAEPSTHAHLSPRRCGQMVLGTKVNGWGWPSWFFWWVGRWMRPRQLLAACGMCFFFVRLIKEEV